MRTRSLILCALLTVCLLSVLAGCATTEGRPQIEKMPVSEAEAEAAQAAATHAQRIFLTSDNPRNEDPQAILDEIREGVSSVNGAMERCRIIPDRREAVRAAAAEAEPSDVLVLAGKGHETTQTLGTRVEPFDDRVVAVHTLAELGWDGIQRAGT